MTAGDGLADAGLGESWEELDDNYSVLSVPTSEDEDPEDDLISTVEASLSCELVPSPKAAPSLELAPSSNPVTASISDDQPPSDAAPKHPQRQSTKFPSPPQVPALNPKDHTRSNPSDQQQHDDPSKNVSPPQVVCHTPVVSPQTELPKTDVPKPTEMPKPSSNQLDVLGPDESTPEQKTHNDKSSDAVCMGEPESEKPSLKLVLTTKTEDTACWFRRNIDVTVDLTVATTEPATAYHRLERLEHGIQDLGRAASGEKYYQVHAKDIVMLCHLLLMQIREIKPALASNSRSNKSKARKANVEITPDFILWITSRTQVVSAISRGIDVLGFPKEGLSQIDQNTRLTTLENLMRFLVPYSCEVRRLISTHKSRDESSLPKNNDGSLPHLFYDHLERFPDLNFCVMEHMHNLEHVLNQLKQEVNRVSKGMDEWCASLPRNEELMTKAMSTFLSISSMGNIDNMLEDIMLWRSEPSLNDPLPLGSTYLRNINPFTVEKFANRLKTICDVVQLGPVESRIWSADEIREHYRNLLIDHGLFNNLCGLYRSLTRFLSLAGAPTGTYELAAPNGLQDGG
ncbi:hypothetical protein CPLU01_05885 [Colletotrichum plurivorum]|uniref:Uncharacterized protein n=1 Tax=Colletotrichum plurivorum TaxID=2175906 RepID=A0A8H6NHS6_9PEZI|nr:hypothetical protein CPLU01_05885 [Colletotrichum plurivorum]